MFTEQVSQALAFMDVLNSAAVNNTTATSAKSIDMSKVKRAFYLATVDAVSSGNGYFQLVSSPNANLNSVHAITGCNTGNVNTANTSYKLEVRADQVAQGNSGDRYVGIQFVTTGVLTVRAVGFGADAEQGPAGGNYDLNTTFLGSTNVSSV